MLQVGHALVSTAVSKLIAGSGAVAKLSIIPRTGGALGFTYIPPSTGGQGQAIVTPGTPLSLRMSLPCCVTMAALLFVCIKSSACFLQALQYRVQCRASHALLVASASCVA